jgi:guanine deaminase
MCLGAIYWSRIHRIFYAATRADAAAAGFDDAAIYQELEKNPEDRRVCTMVLEHSDKERPFQAWRNCTTRREY